MARAKAVIFKTTNPAGWAWTFDIVSTLDGSVDNSASAANPNAAMDAIKPLIQAMQGTLSRVEMTIDSFEPQP